MTRAFKVLTILLLTMAVCGVVLADGVVVGRKIADYTIAPIDCEPGGFKVAYQFATADIAASAAAELPAAGGQSTNYYYVMPTKGAIVGVSIASTAATTVAALTVNVTIDGTSVDMAVSLADDGTNTTYNSATQNRLTDTFDAEARLGIYITAGAAYAPSGSSDLVITVMVGQ